VVDASEDPEVTVLGLQRAVARKVRPVVPVLAVLLLVVLRVVRLDEPVGVSVDGLEDTRPGIADGDVAGLLAAFGNWLALFVEDLREDSKDAGATAPTLHPLQRPHGGA